MRFWLRVSAIVIGLIFSLVCHYLWKAIKRPSPWPRRFLAWVRRAAGLRVRIVGQPLPSNVLFVANHVSWLDIMLIGGTTGATFVSRDDVRHWPVVGWLAQLNRTIFVARDSRRGVKDQAEALRAELATGHPVALFPEGTTAGGHEVLPFRASLLTSLVPPLPGLRVQPIAIDYGVHVHSIAWVGDEPAGTNARRVLSRRESTTVTLSFLAPVDPNDAPDRKVLARTAREEIVAALGASAPDGDPL